MKSREVGGGESNFRWARTWGWTFRGAHASEGVRGFEV